MLFKQLLLALGVSLSSYAFAQGVRTNIEFEKYRIGDSHYIVSSAAWTPGKHEVTLGSTQSNPICFYDPVARKVTREAAVPGYYSGPRIRYSQSGTYLLLEQQFYLDLSPNRDKPVEFSIMEVSSGKIVFSASGAQDADITPDERQVITVEGNQVVYYSLPEGQKIRSVTIPYIAYGLHITPDGSSLLISHHPLVDDIEAIPSIRQDKSGMKLAQKYREVVSVFDIQSVKQKLTVPEIYDVIYRIDFSADGKRAYVYSKPHTKVKPTGAGLEGYVSMIETESWTPSRIAYPSRVSEPDFKESPTGRWFALVSFGKNSPQVQVFDPTTGDMVTYLDLGLQGLQKLREMEVSDGRIHFLFLPDEDEILVFSGNQIIQWRIKE